VPWDEVRAELRVEIGRRAQRSLRALEAAIDLLADNPRPPRRVGVVGEPNTSRVLVGVYRNVYDILDERPVIQTVRVGHRWRSHA